MNDYQETEWWDYRSEWPPSWPGDGVPTHLLTAGMVILTPGEPRPWGTPLPDIVPRRVRGAEEKNVCKNPATGAMSGNRWVIYFSDYLLPTMFGTHRDRLWRPG